ncbi:PTS transporter subunit EIIC [Curtobacterium sp. NPDC089991]|uniref:PTS transporter subunit EIIC n=1 Tax=Curtobacterium sp. NPDC089991 TaxID=3363969 RepID=UPI0038230386
MHASVLPRRAPSQCPQVARPQETATTNSAAIWLLANGGAFAGFVLGGFFLPLVMTGMHQAPTPIHPTLIDQTGWTVLLPVLAMGGAGQIGAALALWMRFRRNEALSRTIRGALPAGLLGVGEPLIYGVTLPSAARSSPRASAARSAAAASDCSTSSGTPSGRSPSARRTCPSSPCSTARQGTGGHCSGTGPGSSWRTSSGPWQRCCSGCPTRCGPTSKRSRLRPGRRSKSSRRPSPVMRPMLRWLLVPEPEFRPATGLGRRADAVARERSLGKWSPAGPAFAAAAAARLARADTAKLCQFQGYPRLITHR